MKKSTSHMLIDRITVLAFIAIILGFATCAKAQNKKPVTQPDTCTGVPINVLANDKDPNKDPIQVTKFNGFSFGDKDKIAIVKKDTGTFYLDKNGNFSFDLNKRFIGSIIFNYHANDGTITNGAFKGKASAATKGTIVFKKSKDTVFPKSTFSAEYFLSFSYDTACKDEPAGRYWVTVNSGTGQKFQGWLEKQPSKFLGANDTGKAFCMDILFYVYNVHFYTGELTKEEKPKKMLGIMEVTPYSYIYITSNSCRRK
jgi:hypothetical protein